MQAGEQKAAEGELRQAIALAPDDATALSMLGGALGMQGRLAESTSFFERALQLDPKNAGLRRNLAANQIRLGQAPAAIRNLTRLIESDPGDRQAILMLGLVRAQTQDFVQAIKYLEQVPDLVRQHPDHMVTLVRSYYHTGQKEKARRLLLQLQNSSADPDSIYLGGQMSLEAHDWVAAEQLFVSLKSSYPKPVRVDYQLARVYYETGRAAECRQMLEPIANSQESSGSVLNLLASCFLKDGDKETGIRILLYAIDRFPAETANFIDLGRFCLRENKIDVGLEALQRGVAANPGAGRLYELKGELESRKGLDPAAAQSYAKALQLRPRSPEALLGLAIARTNLLQNKEARANFEQGLRQFPGDARFYAEYGKVLLLPWASGEVPDAAARAERLLEKAVQLDDSHAMAHFELGNLLLKSQRASASLPHLEKAAKLDAQNSQIHFVLANAYRALGRGEDANREMLLFERLESSAPAKAKKP